MIKSPCSWRCLPNLCHDNKKTETLTVPISVCACRRERARAETRGDRRAGLARQRCATAVVELRRSSSAEVSASSSETSPSIGSISTSSSSLLFNLTLLFSSDLSRNGTIPRARPAARPRTVAHVMIDEYCVYSLEKTRRKLDHLLDELVDALGAESGVSALVVVEKLFLEASGGR